MIELTTDLHGRADFVDAYTQSVIEIEAAGYHRIKQRLIGSQHEFVLKPGGPTSVEVRSARGEPVAEALVQVRSDAREIATDHRTDSEGRVEIGTVSPSESLTIHLFPQDAPAYRWQGVAPDRGPLVISIPSGIALEGLVLSPDGEPAVGGWVFVVAASEVGQENANPLATVRYRASRRGRSRFQLMTRHRARIGRDGRYHTRPFIPEGDEQVLFYHPRFANHLVALSGQTVLDYQFEAGATISGRVLGLDGEPRSGVLLHLGEIDSDDAESVVGRTRTDERGEFCFVGVPTGARRRKVSGRWIERRRFVVAPFAPYRIVSTEQGRAAGSAALTVQAGDRDLILEVDERRESEEFTVTLTTGRGERLNLWTPYLIASGGVIRSGALGEPRRGPLEFSSQIVRTTLPARLLAMPPRPWAWRSCDFEEGTPKRVEVRLVGRRAPTLRLVVNELSGLPLAAHSIAIQFDSGTGVVIGTTDSSGTIEVDFLDRPFQILGRSGGLPLGSVHSLKGWKPLGWVDFSTSADWIEKVVTE